MLCHFCQNLVFVPVEEVSVHNADWLTDPNFVRDPDTWLVSVHQPSREALELSAGQGCRVCAMFWFQLFQHNGSADTRHDNDPEVASILLSLEQFPWGKGPEPQSRLLYEMKLRYGERLASLGMHYPVSDDVSTMLDISCVLSPRSEEQFTPIGSAIDNHTGSDHNMNLIKTWVQHCQKEHQYCNTKAPSQTLPLLPTRVIEIETDGQARVMETKGMRAEYLTLSYCWGQGKKMLSTLGSGIYEQFKRNLPLDDTMPKTFRDALQVTKALGYRYLWIDALCIIQDDLEDLGKEMTMMGGIYRQSTLTIFAANGPDTNSGLFSKRDARGSKSCNVRMTLKGDSNCLRTCVSIQPFAQYYCSALQTRGWVLQEEVLSGRLLTFNTNAVEWSCVTTFARESFPFMARVSNQEEAIKIMSYHTNNGMRLIVRLPDIFNKLSLSSYEGRRHNHFDKWYDMAAHYSRRALSVDSDKLLAVAGLASLMGEHYHLNYVTGLWKEDLQVGLCWWVTSRNDVFRRDGPRSIENPPEHLAPTWSWASAHGMCVDFLRTHINRLPEEGMQVVDVEVSHLPGALGNFGYINFAKLSIRTKMRRIFLAPRQANLKQNFHPGVDEETGGLRVHAFDALTGSLVDSVYLDTVKLYEDILTRYSADRLLTNTHSAPEGTGSQSVRIHQLLSDGYEAWCVPCLVEKSEDGYRMIVSLVLTPINADRRVYQRIGITQAWSKDNNRFMVGEDVHEDREIIHIL